MFSRPKPIDISSARGGRFIDLEMEDEDVNEEQSRPLIGNAVLPDGSHERTAEELNGRTPMPHAARGVHDRDAEDIWAELG